MQYLQGCSWRRIRSCPLWVSSVQNICGTLAAYVRFALAALYLRFGPKADLGTAAKEASQKACRCVSALSQRWAGRKYFVGILSHYGVALAADVFERRAIQDLDVTAPVADQAGALQEARRDGHCGAPHAEHLPEKLLRQWDGIAVDAIVRLQ